MKDFQFKYIGEALILAIGLFLAGGAIKSGIVKFKELGNDPAELYDRIESNTQTVVSFLKANGLSEEEISIAPPAMVDQQANMSYSSEQVRYRYKANCVVTVVSKNVDLVRKIVSNQAKLMRQGVTIVSNEYDETSNVTYEFTGLNDIKPEMIAEATKNARKTAEQFATDSNSELGKIKTADQGQFSINDRDQNTPWLKNIRVVTTVVYYLKD